MEENQTNFGSQTAPNNPVPPPETEKAPILYKRPVGPITFGLIVLMFFFTFINIKCNGVSLGTIKGYELATGYSLNKGGGDKHREPLNLFALGALTMGVVGFGIAFIRTKPGSILKIITGFLGFLNLLLLFASLKYDASKSSKGGGDDLLGQSMKITVNFEIAFWIALLLFVFGGVLGIFELNRKKT